MKDAVVLVTGATGGIGLEVVRHLVESGHRKIACAYRSKQEALYQLLESHDLDPQKHAFQAELTEEEHVSSLRERIEGSLGKVQGLVHVAGGSSNGLSWKLSKGEFDAVVSQNLTSAFLCAREFTPGMRELGTGRIITVSSIVANTGVAGAAHYAAAKAAVVGFSNSLALELAPKGICVNVVALGYFQYGLINHLSAELQQGVIARIPLKRLGRGNEIGGVIQFLLSEDAGYITGQVLHVNGGLYS